MGKSRYATRLRCRCKLLISWSSLVLRFVKDQFDDYRESTIGGAHPVLTRNVPTTELLPTAAFLTQTVSLDDGTSVKFEIWYV